VGHGDAEALHEGVQAGGRPAAGALGSAGAEIARELGIRRNQLYKWAEQLKGKGATRAFLGAGPRRAAADDLTRLKRELAQVTEERDILKKAAAFFARHSA
jgi:transposase